MPIDRLLHRRITAYLPKGASDRVFRNYCHVIETGEPVRNEYSTPHPRVNARWVDRAGRHPRFYFSVTDENGDVYQLQLQAGDLLWWLDSVMLES